MSAANGNARRERIIGLACVCSEKEAEQIKTIMAVVLRKSKIGDKTKVQRGGITILGQVVKHAGWDEQSERKAVRFQRTEKEG